MVLDFAASFTEALERISFAGEHLQFAVHEAEEMRTYLSSDEIIERYGQAKWAIVDILNERYSRIFNCSFDLYNWLNENQEDEISYFLNEAGSNSLNYSEFKAPNRFHLWLGEKGFIIAVEQKGRGFDAEAINSERVCSNEGKAFNFFRNCQSRIFFDHPRDARMVFMEWGF